MSRPKPNILLEHLFTSTYKCEQVLEAEAIYAVYYKGMPINLRTAHHLVSYPAPKYKKSVFVNSGHAFNLAEKLNELFKSTDFTVHRLVAGEQITEGNK